MTSLVEKINYTVMPKPLVGKGPSGYHRLQIDYVRHATVVGHGSDGALSVWTYNITTTYWRIQCVTIPRSAECRLVRPDWHILVLPWSVETPFP